MVRPFFLALFLGALLATPVCQAQDAPAAPANDAATSTAPEFHAVPAEDASVVSHVRIVRLSQIQGKAELDRNTGRGFEPAFANIPITSGSRLRTTAEGTAEVEFEEGSTLRLAPGAEVDFAQLGRTATGQTVTVVQLVQGTAYASLVRTPAHLPQARFTMTADKVNLNVQPGTHLRLGFGEGKVQVAVMDGAVDLQGPAGNTVIAKKQSTQFETVSTAPYTVADNIQPEPFDSWDKESDKYQRRYSTASFNGGSGMMFGSADLNYYGSFGNAGGCGLLWRPYFASAAWDPYASGVWAWYPGAGYSWVSPYPWGWMPFHSGSWQMCPGVGWGWAPGSSWYGLGNQLQVLHRIANKGHGPVEPLPPGKGAPHYVVSGVNQLQYSRLTAPGTFTFRSDSAGMGVPRESFGKLHGFSSSVARHGAAVTEAEVGMVGAERVGAERAGAQGGRALAGAPVHAVAVLGRPGARSGGESPSMSAAYAGGGSSRGAGNASRGSMSASAGSSMGSSSHSSGGGAVGGSSSGGGGGHH